MANDDIYALDHSPDSPTADAPEITCEFCGCVAKHRIFTAMETVDLCNDCALIFEQENGYIQGELINKAEKL